MRRSIFFNHTDDPMYIKKRKELSGAFFKSKLIMMMEIIKEVTLREVKLVQESKNLDNYDVTPFTLSL